MGLVRWVAACVYLTGSVLATGAAAQEFTVKTAEVRACFMGSDFFGALPDCVGAAAIACEAANGHTTIVVSGCQSAEAQAWDDLLNEVYQEARPELAQRDVDYGYSLPTAEALRDAQRAWIAFRDAECALQYAMYQDGTIRSVVGASCRLDLTARRVFELRSLLLP